MIRRSPIRRTRSKPRRIKSGMEPERKLSQSDYIALQWRVRARDEWRCRHCGSGTARLEGHHIIGRAHCGPDSYENLITLCQPCHREITDCRLFIIGDALTARFTTVNPRRAKT